MKRYLLTGVLALTMISAFAQQDPKFNHFMFNTLVLNPGSAGMRNGISAMLMHRTQWAGLGPGSPLTTTFTIHSPVKILRGGVGLSVMSDEFGFSFRTQGASLNYSYHKKIKEGTLGIGASLGFMRRSLDPSKFKALDAGDSFIPTGITSSTLFDLGLGAWYSTSKYYLGVSMAHVNAASFKLENSNATIPFERNVYLQGGYTFQVADKFKVLPNALVKINPGATQIDLNANVMYNDRIWLGASWTSQDALVALIGANITDALRFGYSYDITTSSLRTQQDGTHEIFLAYDFTIKIPAKPKVIIKSPRFL